MKERVRQLREIGDKLFNDRRPLMAVWQDMAMNFYPERADFLFQRTVGTEFASHLMTGIPALARRDMSNTLSAMLRPRGEKWFRIRTADDRVNKDANAKKWLDWATDIQWRFMYDPAAKMLRATKECDNDFVTFGQGIIQVRENQARDGLIHICHHLRDVVWLEDAEQRTNHIHRDWKQSARNLVQLFKDRTPQPTKEAAEKDPAKETRCRHIVLPRDEYESYSGEDKRPGKRLPFVSIYIDCDNEAILEETGAYELGYIIPRWQTVSGSQYAHSPATVIALADARMLQQINLTLLEAGQKSVDPPLIAQSEVIQGGVNTFAGGITWLDYEYDERLGEGLRPLTIDRGGIPWGDRLQERIEATIKKAFFLDDIQAPDMKGDVTAYQYQKMFEEYIRRALPLFEPMETEYNAALCEADFNILLRNNAFGSIRENMPQILRGQEIKFAFESPIQGAQSRANVQAFQESAQLLGIAAQLDPSARHRFNTQEALKDALDGAGAQATWINSDEDVQAAAAADAQQAALMNAANMVSQGADVANKVGGAAQALQAGGIMQGAM